MSNIPGPQHFDSTATNEFVTLMDETEGAFPPYEVIRYDMFVRKLLKKQGDVLEILHSALGVCGEAGELADAIKKEYIYGKERDRANIVEELGDLKFYMQAVANHYGISQLEIIQGNADKLGLRYKKLQYSDQAAQERADKVGVQDAPDK